MLTARASTTATSNEGHAMSQPLSSRRPLHRRRTAKTVLTATALTTPFLVVLPAWAAPCRVDPATGKLTCAPAHTEGGSSGGGGGGGGGGSSSSGSIAPPDPEGLTDGQAIDFVPVDQGAPAPAPAAPATWELVQSALDSAEFPVPKVHTAPNGKTYVRMSTSLWVDGFEQVQTRPVSAGDQTVVARAVPISVTWSLGEKTLVCEDGGSSSNNSCTYTYQRSSAGQPGGSFKITATIAWDVTWTCQGSACDAASGDLGQETRTSVPTPLVVGEIQTNTGN